MPRTVPKTVAKLAPTIAKTKSTNTRTLCMEKFSPNGNYRAASKPQLRLINESRSRAELCCRGMRSRRGSEGFNETRKIQGLRQFDRRLCGRYSCCRCRWRQHERNRAHQRAIGIVAARHGASHHSRHVMPAIHVIVRRGGSFLVMMGGNRALAGQAASGLIRQPGSPGERRVKQNNHQQANACRNRSPVMDTCR